NQSGGTKSFTGAITDLGDGDGNGISLTNNTGATTSFTGQLTLATGANPALTATGGGTVSATNAGSTLATTTATALNVANTTIGDSDLTFRSIASNGASTGIVLNNTGNANGRLAVGGNGGTCTSAGSCTGGAIQESTGQGVVLNSVPGGVSLTRMFIGRVAAGGDDGINGTTVNGFSMDHSVVQNNGNAAAERGLEFSNLTGTVAMDTDTVSGNAEDGLQIVNDTGTMNASVTNGSYSNQSTTGTGNDGILMVGTNTANETLNIQGSAFATNRGDHVQVSNGGGSPTQDVTVNGTTMTSPASGILGGGITISPSGGAHVTSRVTNNSITNSKSSSVNHNFVSGSGTMDVRVTGNTLTAPGADEVQLYNTGTQTVKALVDSNTMSGHNFAGIDILSGDGDGSMNVTATHTTISGGGTNAFAGIFADMGTTDPNAAGHPDQGTSCLDIGSTTAGLKNSILNSKGPSGTSDIRIKNRFAVTVRLPGYTGAATGANILTSYLQNRNNGNGTPSESDSASSTSGWANTSPAGSACPQPAP
ncbi:MAG: hypothetical protein QOH74_1349, partial [Gaiellales bacterium]|nr:hypothetical protein [Gaiellales bacterium]